MKHLIIRIGFCLPDRIPSPAAISTCSDDHPCVQASRVDHGLDLVDNASDTFHMKPPETLRINKLID